MKKIGDYTIRGSILEPVPGAGFSEGVEKRFILFDGRFDTGYKVTDFRVASGDVSYPDMSAMLGTVEGLATATTNWWNWGDDRQVAWTTVNGATDLPVFEQVSTIDPDNLVIEDLFITVRFGSDPAGYSRVNYMVTLEKYQFSEWRGALAMVKNNAQSV